MNKSKSMKSEVAEDICDNLFAKSYVNHGFDCSKSGVNTRFPNSNYPSRTAIGLRVKDSYESSKLTLNENSIGASTKNNNFLDHRRQLGSQNNNYLSKSTTTSGSRAFVETSNRINDSSHFHLTTNCVPTCISIIWNNLTFQVTEKSWHLQNGFPSRKVVLKKILHHQNGHIFTGSLTALMGPSGAGKSSLLNCITGRYMRGVTGEISITCPGVKPKANIAFVPQKDDLFVNFTVKETLIFASKMKNLRKDVHHQIEAWNVAENLNLKSCYDIRLTKCSGGELKRVSIAVELISNPDILIIDEPTSGLDSSTAIQCVQLLRKLVEGKNPIAVVATIHQPNYRIFREFTSIYLLSRTGQNIYFGPPSGIIGHFSNYNLECPTICNPADFAIEVASGDHGDEVLNSMDLNIRSIKYSADGRGSKFDIQKVIYKLRMKQMPFFKHTGLLMKRIHLNLMRSSCQFWVKNLAAVIITLESCFLYQYKIGEADGCWDTTTDSIISTSELKQNFFKVNLTTAQENLLTATSRVSDNTATIICLMTLLTIFTMVPACLFFPFEFSTIRKEIINSWYKSSTFFIAKTIVDIPPMLLTTCIVLGLLYPLTGQIMDPWRFFIVFLAISLMGQICLSLGTIFSILLYNDIEMAALVSVTAIVPIHVFCGMYVRYSKISWFFTPMNYISFHRLAFDTIHIALYGFGRCKLKNTEGDLARELTGSKSAKDLIELAWKRFNYSLSDIGHFSSLLKINQECLTEVSNATSEYLELKYYDSTMKNGPPSAFSGAEEENTFPPEHEHPSFVLSYHELTDESMMARSLGFLTVYALVLLLAVYFAIRYRTKSAL